MSDKFKAEIISPDKSILKTDTNEVVLPSYEGEIGILKDHAPLITFLRPGKVEVFSKEEKEILSKREEIKKKLKKLAGRLPVFMYLTDYREERLKDVITQLDSRLFKKVTSISVQEFEKLVTLGVFDDKKMDKAVGDFKRYENSSLTYSGVSKHKNLKVGLWQTVITSEEHDATI